MKLALWILSIAALSGCAVSAAMIFLGAIDDATFKWVFLLCSVLWFAISSARIYLPAKS